MPIRRTIVRLDSLLAPALLVLALGCSSEERPAHKATPPSDGGNDASAGRFSVHLDVVFEPDDDGGSTLTFFTPALSTYTTPVADVVGKPYYVAVFTGGFDQGVDLDLHHEWGTIPEDLHVTYESPKQFSTGPYDVAFIVYTKTPITDAIRNDYFTVVRRQASCLPSHCRTIESCRVIRGLRTA
jgi:hypothetical protein